MSNTTLFNSPCFMLKVDVALIQVLGRRLPHHQQHGQNSLRFPDDMAILVHADRFARTARSYLLPLVPLR